MYGINFGDIVRFPKQGQALKSIYLGEQYRGYIHYNKLFGYYEFASKQQHIFLIIDTAAKSILSRYSLMYKTGDDLGSYDLISYNTEYGDYNYMTEFTWLYANGDNVEALVSTLLTIVRSEGTAEAFKLKHPLRDVIDVYCTVHSLSSWPHLALDVYKDTYNAFGRYISLEGSY